MCALNHHIISTLSPGCQFLYLCCWCNNKRTCGDMERIWGNVHSGPCRVPGTPECFGKWKLWSSPSLSLQPIHECPGQSYVHTDKSERKQSPRRKQDWGRALAASGTARCKFKPPCLLIGSPWPNHLTLVSKRVKWKKQYLHPRITEKVKCWNVLSTVPGTAKAQGGRAVDVIILLRKTMLGFAGKGG